MQTILIPSIPDLKVFGTGPMHLVLSHLLSDARYFTHYRREATRGAYVILDNSAHEFQLGQPGKILLKQAQLIGASEIVCPDELFSVEGTCKLTDEALSYFSSMGYNTFRDLNPRLMLVPQGKTREEYDYCYSCMTDNFSRHRADYPEVFTKEPVIGISKDYLEMFEGGLYDIVKMIYPSLELGADIHMLGWGRTLWAYADIARDFPKIRSVDSAKPMVYAMRGICLEAFGEIPPYPRRDPDYFNSPIRDGHLSIAQHNVRVFEQVARGDNGKL